MLESFPFINKPLYNIPPSFKYTHLIAHNLHYVYGYYKTKKDSGFKKGYGSKHITELSYIGFKDLILKFTQEFAEYSIKTDIHQNYISRKILFIKEILSKTIDLIEQNRHEFFSIEMHNDMFPVSRYEKNWYELIYNELDYIRKFFNHYETNPVNKIFVSNKNPHPEIFKDGGFYLFQELVKEFVRERYPVKDYSLIYWEMIGKEIHETVKPGVFLDWLIKKKYIIDPKLQLYAKDRGYSDQRKKSYSIIKDSFQVE